MIKVAAMSDLHGDLPRVDPLEEYEVMFICGDISPLNIQSNSRKIRKWLLKVFKPWAEALPCNKVFFIAGNHDLHFNTEFMEEHFSYEDKVTYLFHDDFLYYGSDEKEYLIFGTPYCKQFGNWAYMKSQEELEELYKDIPEDVDILLTHDQPYGYGDIILQDVEWNNGERIGNIALRDAVLQKQPKYMFCGHLHSTSHNCIEIGKTKRYNVSIKDEFYDSVYDPLFLEI